MGAQYVRERMHVPRRILVAGDGANSGHGEPVEMTYDQRALAQHRPIVLATPPSTLTLEHASPQHDDTNYARRQNIPQSDNNESSR
jgi:hypothetical protein